MPIKHLAAGMLGAALPLAVSGQQEPPAAGASITYADGVVVAATPPAVTGMSVSHGPWSGTPTVTGALHGPTTLGTAIIPKPAPDSATTYPSDGQLHEPQPAPYVPGGGLGTNGTEPIYNAKSDFDFESLALAMYNEWIQLDLFQYGLEHFSEEDFAAAKLTPEDRFLIQFMAEQEVGHATLVANMLGPGTPKQCNYNYPPFSDVREWLDFCQKVTRVGESSTYGFLPHMNSREAAATLMQAISTEARQQMVFRQFGGLFPMPVWFEVAVPQSWGWSLLAPYIASCPADQTRLVWQNFPALHIIDQPNPVRTNASAAYNETTGPWLNSLNSSSVPDDDLCIDIDCPPAITNNRTNPLSYPGRPVQLAWEAPGLPVGPNASYVTSTTAQGQPLFVAWVTQLNVSYSPLIDVMPGGGGGGGGAGGGAPSMPPTDTMAPTDVPPATTMMKVRRQDSGMTGGGGGGGAGGTGKGSGTWESLKTTGRTIQPDLATYEGDPATNGTIFVAIVDTDLYLTPYNLTLINEHVIAGPAIYQAG
ncbi:hypothetical protein AJ79_09439 [Helicocarpus griseus UAMH5409]|uniref:Protein rds1 n=1 Tax=Helicocarpus griseus UAMH5409 TaxID=1447875 RepID=A0A2B7WBD7_9EURO|nr:hypothetical protein AJ79_09439 [Helicocarpus griseus UAMH5409]